MVYTHEDLQLVGKHVAQAERNVQQQRNIVHELQAHDYPTREALTTLASLEATLLMLRERHERIHDAITDAGDLITAH